MSIVSINLRNGAMFAREESVEEFLCFSPESTNTGVVGKVTRG